MKWCVIVCASLLGMFVSPPVARADWFASPMVGTNVGAGTVDPPRLSLAASAGWMSKFPLGVEVEYGWSPDYFRADDVPLGLFSGSSVTTLMFNARVALPGRGRLRPYAVGGVGLVRSRIGQRDEFIRATNNHTGIDVGGGATWMVREHYGVRGDVRYVRDIQEITGQSEFFNLGGSRVDYWRAAAGFVFSF